jgi:hypothetical protein
MTQLNNFPPKPTGYNAITGKLEVAFQICVYPYATQDGKGHYCVVSTTSMDAQTGFRGFCHTTRTYRAFPASKRAYEEAKSAIRKAVKKYNIDPKTVRAVEVQGNTRYPFPWNA